MNRALANQIQASLPELQLRQVYKFGVHANKGPWNGVSLADALHHLQKEVNELILAVGDNRPYEEVADEAADVANMALIVMTNYRQKIDQEEFKRRSLDV